MPSNQPSQNNPNVYFQTSLSSPRPESLIAAKPSGMVSWNNSPSSVWDVWELGCQDTPNHWELYLDFFVPTFGRFIEFGDFFSQWLGEKKQTTPQPYGIFSCVFFVFIFCWGCGVIFCCWAPIFWTFLCLFQTLPSLTPRTATRKICALASHKASKKMSGRLAGHQSNQREIC